MGQDSRKWDARIRQTFIPILGLTIPAVTGLYGSLAPRSPWYWVGAAWFTLLSFLIWWGNLEIARRWGRRMDWLRRPLLRTGFLLLTSALYTVPLSIAMLWIWFSVLGSSRPDWGAIVKATALCAAVDLFIKNTYETVYLIRQRARDALAVEHLERAKLLADLQALKSQVDPHFIFNSLNTLAGLIEDTPAKATEFVVALGDVYRYFASMRERELVPLDEEVRFVEQYFLVLRVRFGDAVQLNISGATAGRVVPPAALQTLLENTVKHNRVSAADPLTLYIRIEPDSVRVWNEKRPKADQPWQSGSGLRNLDSRCRLLLQRGLEIEDSPHMFTVIVPLGRGGEQ